MKKFFAIFSSNGILQWHGRAKDETKAWEQFRSDLGYERDIPNVCERSKYSFMEGAEAIKTVREMGLLN